MKRKLKTRQNYEKKLADYKEINEEEKARKKIKITKERSLRTYKNSKPCTGFITM